MEKTWYGDTQAATQAIPSTPLAIPAPIASSLGHSSSGNSVIAAAASQAIAATQQVINVNRFLELHLRIICHVKEKFLRLLVDKLLKHFKTIFI